MSFFSKKAIGIDIADHTIEIAQLSKTCGRVKVVALTRVILEPGIVEHGRIKNKEKLTKALQTALASAKPKAIFAKEVIFGLPESQVYTHVFTLNDLGKIDNRALDLIIKEEISQNIPLNIEELVYSYKLLVRNKERIEVLVVAASKETVLEWHFFFRSLKIEVDFFDIETLAVFRDLFAKTLNKPVCIVDIGAVNTNISIFDSLGLHYSGLVPVAGDNLSQIFVKSSNKKDKNITQADKDKIKFNFNKSKDKKTVTAVIEILDKILEEIKQSIKYWHKQSGLQIQEVVLVGGSSQLKGLREYFVKQLGLKVRLGTSRLLQSEIPLVYIEAIGLCLRVLNKKQYKQDPNFVIKAIKVKDKKKNQKTAVKAKADKVTNEVIEEPVNALGNNQSKEETIEAEKDGLQILDDSLEIKDNTHSRLATLIIILIIGAIVIGLSLWYRSNERAKKATKIRKQVEASTNLNM